jgi:hypothetical protein
MHIPHHDHNDRPVAEVPLRDKNSRPQNGLLNFCATRSAGWQRERALSLITRFMAWKLARSFVLVAETWLSAEITRAGEEAILVELFDRASGC